MGGDLQQRRKRGRSHSPSRSRSADRKRSSGGDRDRDRDRDRHTRDRQHQARRSRSRSAPRNDRDRGASAPAAYGIDEEEAERIARIARLAEERAEQRAAERKRAAAAAATGTSTARTSATAASSSSANDAQGSAAVRKLPVALGSGAADADDATGAPKVAFRSKAQRQQDALARLEQKRQEMEKQRRATEDARRQFQQRQRDARRESYASSVRDRPGRTATPSASATSSSSAGSANQQQRTTGAASAIGTDPRSSSTSATTTANSSVDEKALEAIKAQYLGKREPKKKVVKASEKYAKNYRFDWEASEDTSNDLNPLYANRLTVNLLYGRGYRAGVDMREQRKNNSFLTELSQKRQREHRLADEQNAELSSTQLAARQRDRERAMRSMQSAEQSRMRELAQREAETMGTHWSEKALSDMRERDWRIFREDFDITIQGGRAPHPLRKWSEAAGLPAAVFQAIAELGFERPSPIQMQSIPIGLERRDIIGIAETGSGKTAAFMIPIIAYIYSLPPVNVNRTPEQGPLALVMAPTRELALQIEQEAIKLCKHTCVGDDGKEHAVKTLSVVGGQSIEDQAFKLREGIDIVIGTPGRLMDCLENHYLVLNQCNYVVLDEADRMIDMGFEPQVVAVLDNMGSLLKSENEEEMEQQISLAVEGKDHRYRVTTMFSATMPTEVERLAKTYLRHPAIVKIGDEDSSKNKRIDQRVLFMNSGKKKGKLVEILGGILRDQPRSRKEKAVDGYKVIVFVNIKKECDVVAKMLATSGFRITVLHGGKSQDQREESLRGFREGYCDVLVATDVAGRGLDIPDVTHVINYDLPSKIQSYSHRIGRTGRAGKQGIAISLLTDDDEDIMFDLKQYLVSTDMPVPTELANHPSAKAAPGARDDKGNVIARSKRDTVIFAK